MRATALLSVLALAAGCDGDGAATIDAPENPQADASIDGAVSVGCGQPGAATGVFDGMITVGGVARRYLRVVPANYDPQRAYPLIFAWHGRGSTGAVARQYFRIETTAGDAAIIVYPFGLPVTADPNDFGWILTEAGRDVALFDALQADLATSYCIGRTYSMGHSFGGYMSNAIGCYRGGTAPNAVRAIAPIAGGGPFTACSGEPISAVIIHGISDGVVPFTQGEGSRDAWRTDAACATTSQAITPAPCVAYDGCASGLAVQFCAHTETVNNGHGWPAWAATAAWQLFQSSP